MRPLVPLLALVGLAGCAGNRSRGAKPCEGTTFVVATNSTKRWFDLMVDGEKISSVGPGQTLRQAVPNDARGRVHFTETPLKTMSDDRSRPPQPQLVCTPTTSAPGR